jgi:hypothetical protein
MEVKNVCVAGGAASHRVVGGAQGELPTRHDVESSPLTPEELEITIFRDQASVIWEAMWRG